VKILDGVTQSIAESYTQGNDAKAKFRAAAAGLQTYIAKVHDSRGKGNMPPETEALLVDQANTLAELLRKA
jgi:hypothetical protein